MISDDKETSGDLTLKNPGGAVATHRSVDRLQFLNDFSLQTVF